MNFELIDSKIELEKIVGKKINTFCWVGGELNHYTEKAYNKIIEAGYNFSFTTNSKLINKNSDKYNLNRTNIETSYPMYLVLFQLSGLMDFLYVIKRIKLIENQCPIPMCLSVQWNRKYQYLLEFIISKTKQKIGIYFVRKRGHGQVGRRKEETHSDGFFSENILEAIFTSENVVYKSLP